jgi:hypothetical protein
MTIADHIRAEVKLDFIKNMLEKDLDAKFIADVVEMPIKEVREIIKKIKESNQ